MSLFVLVGSLTSSPDPNIIVEALNFLLSSEVGQNFFTHVDKEWSDVAWDVDAGFISHLI